METSCHRGCAVAAGVLVSPSACAVERADCYPRSLGRNHQVKSGREALSRCRGPVGRRRRPQPAVAFSTPETTLAPCTCQTRPPGLTYRGGNCLGRRGGHAVGDRVDHLGTRPHRVGDHIKRSPARGSRMRAGPVRWCDPGSIESIRVIRATRPNQGQPGAAENVKNQSRPALLLNCVPYPATITCLT